MARVTVNSMPVELLLDILDGAERDPVKWTSVCGHWRRTALRTPSLWTTITLYDARPDASLDRARTFLDRAGDRPLSVLRHGLRTSTIPREKYSDAQEPDSFRVLDALLEMLFSRCESVTYEGIGRGQHAVHHIARLIQTSAPCLSTLNLRFLPHEITLPEDVLLQCGGQQNFPGLRALKLDIACLPYEVFNSPSLETLYILSLCVRKTTSCQHLVGIAGHLAPVLRSSRLHTVHIELDWDFHDFPDNPASYLDFTAIFTPARREISIQDTPLAWPRIDALRDGAIQLPVLTHLQFCGLCTQPRTVYTSFYSVVEPALRLLANAPNLESLEIWDWYGETHQEELPMVHMPRLTSLDFQGCDPKYIEALVMALDMPALTRFRDANSTYDHDQPYHDWIENLKRIRGSSLELDLTPQTP